MLNLFKKSFLNIDCDDPFFKSSVERINNQRLKRSTIEVDLFLLAMDKPVPFRDPDAIDKLLKISPLKPKPAFLIKEEDWINIFKKDPLKPIAVFDPLTQLIFLKENKPDVLSHLFIHEAIHSLQESSYNKKDKYFKSQFILLEGLTEEVAVSIDLEFGFYKKERAVFKEIYKLTDFSLTDLAFFKPSRLMSFLAYEIFSDQKNPLKSLDNLIKSYFK